MYGYAFFLINAIMLGTVLMTIGILLFTIFGMNLNTGMIIGFYIIFGIGCGIAFGNTMTVGNLRLSRRRMEIHALISLCSLQELLKPAFVQHWWQQDLHMVLYSY